MGEQVTFTVVEVTRATSDGKYQSLGVASPGGLFVACIADRSSGWCFDRIIHVGTGLAPEHPTDYGRDVNRVRALMAQLEAIPEFTPDATVESIQAVKDLGARVYAVLRAYHDAKPSPATGAKEGR